MDRNIKRIGFINLVVLFAIGVASTILARYTNTLAGQVGIIFLGLGFLVVALGYFQMRMEEAERLERLEFEEINKTAASASIFNTADAEVFPARRSREQFDRFFVPGFTVVLFLLQAGGAVWLINWLHKLVVAPGLQRPTVAMSLFGLFALTLFLLGKYSAGLARLEGTRLLRAGASYMLLGAYVCFVATLSIAAVQLGFPKVDLYAAYALGAVLALVSFETLINLVLEIYRPRVEGKVGRLLYDSRLVGLLAEPEGLFTTAAHALDYQFGFKVSETWFYRFLEKALIWLVLLQCGILVASTCFVFISPGEQGLLERFGSPVASGTVLEPGLHVKLPWPVDRVYRFSTLKIQSFNIGFVPEDEAAEKAVLWTGKHYKDESNWLVASRNRAEVNTNNAANQGGVPADLINLSVPVQFQIKDLKAWEYNHTDAPKLLQQIATREVVKFLASIDLLDLLATGRSEASEQLKRGIQEQADNLPGGALGVNVVLVGIEDLHPPVKVAPKFEEVVGAVQQNEAKVYEAKGYAIKTVTLAKAEAERMVREAQADSYLRVSTAEAQSAQFGHQVQAYHASPRVYMERSYLQALERGITNSRKYVLTTTNTHDLFQLNLEDKIRGDLINDLNIPGPGQR
jgi:regulator of protease activity HflC (stomatin/prohibitin superfamily)